MKIMVIGGGVAGFEAAMAARRTAPDAEIALLCGETLPPYRRPGLSALVKGGEIKESGFFIKPKEFYAENRINLYLGTRVVGVTGGEVATAAGETLSFDRAILCTGSRSCVPPLPGVDGPNVYALREYADLLKLNERLDHGVRRAIVVGGGVLGLELADSLLARGVEVLVLERAERLFPARMDQNASAHLLETLNRIPRLTIRCGVSVASVRSEGVLLGESEAVDADIVLFSAGCRPNTELAVAAGIPVGRGITVDDRMKTGMANIFAAGDSAEFNGRCFGLYNDARATGKVAGTNAAGGDAVFSPEPSPLRLFALGLKLVI